MTNVTCGVIYDIEKLAESYTSLYVKSESKDGHRFIITIVVVVIVIQVARKLKPRPSPALRSQSVVYLRHDPCSPQGAFHDIVIGCNIYLRHIRNTLSMYLMMVRMMLDNCVTS
jgi:hypothetical protein